MEVYTKSVVYVNGVNKKSLDVRPHQIMSILSERLRELRGTQSQSQMAEPLGMKYQHWAKYERGESAPGAELLAKICRAHSCSADWLLGLRDMPAAVTAKGNGAIAFVGSHNSFGVPGESATCSKCPYKKKLKTLEKAFKQTFGT